MLATATSVSAVSVGAKSCAVPAALTQNRGALPASNATASRRIRPSSNPVENSRRGGGRSIVRRLPADLAPTELVRRGIASTGPVEMVCIAENPVPAVGRFHCYGCDCGSGERGPQPPRPCRFCRLGSAQQRSRRPRRSHPRRRQRPPREQIPQRKTRAWPRAGSSVPTSPLASPAERVPRQAQAWQRIGHERSRSCPVCATSSSGLPSGRRRRRANPAPAQPSGVGSDEIANHGCSGRHADGPRRDRTRPPRNMLLDHLPALRDRLADQNIKIGQFDVDLKDQSGGGSASGSGFADPRNQMPQYAHHAATRLPATDPVATSNAAGSRFARRQRAVECRRLRRTTHLRIP